MIQNLRTAFSVAVLSSFALAQNATVSVLHGIPGLPQPVEVFANGNRIFAFDFGELEGPLSVPAGVTNLEIRLNGSPVLQASPNLEADTNYTVVAHLLEGGGNALTAFVNDLSRVGGIGEFFATVAFRHVADAPAVDVFGARFSGREVLVYSDVANGEEGADSAGDAAWLLGGTFDIRLTPTGSDQTAFGPAPVGDLTTGDFHCVFAIGELGQSSFQLVVQTIQTPQVLPSLQTTMRGTACGGQISLSTAAPQFDQDFDVVLTGGTPSGTGILIIGFNDSNFLGMSLPFDLSPLGAPGCALYQDIAGAISVDLDANGSGSITESIPAELAGFVQRNGIYFQYAFPSPGANALDLLFTESVAVETN